MSDSAPGDEALLEVLLREGLVTSGQHARLRRALEAGQPLAKALERAPLLSTLEFLRAQRLAASEGAPPPPPTREGRDADGLPVLEMDIEEEEVSSRPAPRPPAIDWPPPPREEFLAPGAPPPALHDASDDEGVRFIAESNEALRAAILGGAHAVFYRAAAEDSCEGELGPGGVVFRVARSDQRAAGRHIQRLRVMARVEPWRAGRSRGAFRLATEMGEALVLVDSTHSAAEDLVVLYLRG